MIYTSYFAMIKKFTENITPVSISRFPPDWYKGKQVKNLAPSEELLNSIKQGKISEEEYTAQYKAYLNAKVTAEWFKKGISGLFPNTKDGKPIWESETDHVALCCFEKPEDFCHRHILASHLSSLSIPVREAKEEDLEKPSLFGVQKGIICQQVNCQGVMGAGLAKVIKGEFPEVFDSYAKSFNGKKPEDLYGKVGVVPVSQDLFVANIYSQLEYGRSGVYTNEDYLVRGIAKVAQKYPALPVYVPKKIGCGLGGGSWASVLAKLGELKLPNLHLLDTWNKTSVPLRAPLSRLDFLEEVADVLSRGIEKTKGDDMTRKDIPGLAEKEASVLRMIREFTDNEEKIPENFPQLISDYLVERAISHRYPELTQEMIDIYQKLAYSYECYEAWEKLPRENEREM